MPITLSHRFWVYAALSSLAALAWLMAPPAVVKPGASAPLTPSLSLAEGEEQQPSHWERASLQAALRDPFTAYTPPPPQIKKPVVTAFVPQPPAPTAPPLDLTFAGQMIRPDGRHVVYALSGSTVVPLSVGATLPNGYTVSRITAHSVELVYAPLNVRAQLDLPEPPRYEIR